MSGKTWDERFAPIDALVRDMPPVERACGTCAFANIPPMPDDPAKGWVAHCRAPVPINILGHLNDVQLSFAAADAARWQDKRLRLCPAWSALRDPASDGAKRAHRLSD